MDSKSIAFDIKVGAGILLVIALIGLGAWMAWPKPVVETAAPAIQLAGGAVALERKPDATAKPKQAIPKGSTAIRVGTVTVKPKEGAAVNLDWSLVREPDKTTRFIASSPDGQVIGGVDVPIENAAPPPDPKPWAVGLSYDPVKETPGIWIERDVWRVRVGAEVNQTRLRIGGPTAIETRVRVGFTF